LMCNKTMDIVLVIDGSGSLGQAGWDAEIKAANAFVDRFEGTDKANIAVILFSGPRTWSGVYKCFHSHFKKNQVDKNVCRISTETHFTTDMKVVKEKISAMKWPKGSTLTSLALLRAQSELSLGRADAHANIIVFTDGRPLRYRWTKIASRMVRKSARLLWVPVTKYAPLRRIKKWATRRWQENVVEAKSFAELEKPDVVTHLIADLCPKKNPKAQYGRKSR